MKLSNVQKGQLFKIINISNPSARHQTIRLGIGEGSTVTCSHKLPYGPIILKLGRQEVAIGRNLADDITIKILEVC
jgi:Fe2+ transport system protein FeoA